MTLRAAVIGCGRIGSLFAEDPGLADDVYSHAGAYALSPATELVAVCDLNPQAAANCAARWDVDSWFTDAADLLAQARPEIVSICTPDETHYEVARLALEAPSVRAILCEKPLATDAQEGGELVRLANGTGTIVAVAYVRRYAGNMRNLRRRLEEGSLGPVRAVSGWYGNGLLHNGSHWLDLLRMLAGEVEWVEAADRLREGGADPSLDVTLGLSSGGVASLRGVDASNYSIFEMDLLTGCGRVSIRDSGHRVDLFRARPSGRYEGYSELVAEPHDLGDMRNLMLHAVEDLAAALREGRAPLCTAEDALAALRIAMAASKSLAEGRRIETLA